MDEIDEVEVLEVDPDLAVGVDRRRLAEARRACRAKTVEVGRGPWQPVGGRDMEAGFGLLNISGFLARRVGRDRRIAAELLGPGDLLRPWLAPGALASRPYESSWSILSPVRLAVLDLGFAERAAPFPSIAVALMNRLVLRSRHLALLMAAVQQPRVDRRVAELLWQLADRWGRRGPEGVTLEVPLTHDLLAELVAARRPSVTTALTSLSLTGEVSREGDLWRLRDPADQAG